VALTNKQARFINEYIIDLNATQAAIRAGYSEKTAAKIGQENLIKPEIQEALKEAVDAQSKRTNITADRTLKEIARLAFFNAKNLFNPDGSPIPLCNLDDDTAACISGIEVVSIGNVDSGIGQVIKYKISDKNSALEKLCKHLSLYSPQQVEFKDKTPSDPTIDAARRVAFLLYNGVKKNGN
jgi:phage terminase small subunit